MILKELKATFGVYFQIHWEAKEKINELCSTITSEATLPSFSLVAGKSSHSTLWIIHLLNKTKFLVFTLHNLYEMLTPFTWSKYSDKAETSIMLTGSMHFAKISMIRLLDTYSSIFQANWNLDVSEFSLKTWSLSSKWDTNL